MAPLWLGIVNCNAKLAKIDGKVFGVINYACYCWTSHDLPSIGLELRDFDREYIRDMKTQFVTEHDPNGR